MPYVLKPNKLFVKDPEGTGFLPQNVVTDRTTADAVAEIEQASAEEQAAIEAKGAQTRASVPEDYTTLSDSVTDLKSALSSYEDAVVLVKNLAGELTLGKYANSDTSAAGGNLQISGIWEKYWIKQGLKEGIDTAIDAIDDIRDDLPAYYYANDYFQNRLLAVQNALTYANGVCFAFITDVHFPKNAENSRVMLKKVLDKTDVPFVIYGGDTPQLFGNNDNLQNSIDALRAYIATVGKENWYSVRGNHDFYVRTNTDPSVRYEKTTKETHNIMLRGIERRITNLGRNKLCYCIDIDAQNTRIIVLNTSDMATPTGGPAFTTDQAKWFANAIKSVTNKRIIVISHIPSDPSIGTEGSFLTDVQGVLEALANGTSYTIDGEEFTFPASAGNKLICHINGHTHQDLWHFTNKVLAVTTTCDAAYTDDGHGMVLNTITEQAFDVYCINYDDSTVKAIRFGRGNDRGWNYTEGTVLS